MRARVADGADSLLLMVTIIMIVIVLGIVMITILMIIITIIINRGCCPSCLLLRPDPPHTHPVPVRSRRRALPR